MADTLPPPPVQDQMGSFAWLEWYRQLRNYVSTSGSVPWYIINFAGSNITDIAARSHQNLQSLQGGAAGQMYHLSQSQYDSLPVYPTGGLYNQTSTQTRSGIVTNVSLASSGLGTRTLPANYFSRVGKAIKIRLCGLYTTDAAPGNATVSLTINGNTYTSTASFALDGNVTNRIWWFEGVITCRSLGATGTISGNLAWVHSENTVQGTLHSQDAPVVTPVVIDTTIANTIDVLWTATDSGTSISCTCFSIWSEF